MTEPANTPRLYLITPPRFELSRLVALVRAAVAHIRIACVRLDAPGAAEADLRTAADALRPICLDADVALVIAEHFRLVAPLGLDGAHVPARANLRDVRAAIGKDQILGVDCGTSRHAGLTAAEAGADYVAFRPVAEIGGLGDGAFAPLELFQWWAEMIEIPVVAEGGVNPALAAELAPYADFIAPHLEIWDADDIVAALKAFPGA
jgi:thiamine-phosphate pyrophosphorylase